MAQIKGRIRKAQVKATLSANAEMILMYWDIGWMIHERQQHEGVECQDHSPQLSQDIRNELPEVKGFSERNIGRMIAFYRKYPDLKTILPQAMSKLPSDTPSENLPQPGAQLPARNFQQLIANIPWGHQILLIEKIKDLPVRLWYMSQGLEQGWRGWNEV